LARWSSGWCGSPAVMAGRRVELVAAPTLTPQRGRRLGDGRCAGTAPGWCVATPTG
jgi:hypothetical protein